LVRITSRERNAGRSPRDDGRDVRTPARPGLSAAPPAAASGTHMPVRSVIGVEVGGEGVKATDEAAFREYKERRPGRPPFDDASSWSRRRAGGLPLLVVKPI
jgi:hypothetical protein